MTDRQAIKLAVVAALKNPRAVLERRRLDQSLATSWQAKGETERRANQRRRRTDRIVKPTSHTDPDYNGGSPMTYPDYMADAAQQPRLDRIADQQMEDQMDWTLGGLAVAWLLGGAVVWSLAILGAATVWRWVAA